MKENFTDILRNYTDYRLEQVHTAIPGKIESYDESTRLAKVLPLVKMKNTKSIDIPLPVVDNVPVIFPASSAFSLVWALQSGDGCLILFTEAGIGNYLNSSGTSQVNADDQSRHALTDAICIPGLYPPSGIPSSLASFEVDDAGMYEVKNQVESLGGLIGELIQTIENIQTFGSPSQHVLQPTSIAALELIKARFALLLKGG